MTKTAEDYFKERFSSVYHEDKHEKKIQRFDYFDMIDFAQQFASQESAKAVEKDRESRWISVKGELPQIPALEYMEMVNGKSGGYPIITTDGESVWISYHGGDPYIWRAMEHTATYYQYLPSPPTNKG